MCLLLVDLTIAAAILPEAFEVHLQRVGCFLKLEDVVLDKADDAVDRRLCTISVNVRAEHARLSRVSKRDDR